MERTKEFYIYQHAQSEQPWCVQCIVTMHRKRQMPIAYRFDLIVHGEFIPGYHTDCSKWNMCFATGEDFAYAVNEVLAKYGHHLTFEDEQQLCKEFINIISCI